MPVTDEELVRQLESVPLVEPPDFREAVMSRMKAHRPAVKFRPATPRLYLGLAWAAAVAIVIGVAFFRAPEPRPQNAGATMTNASPEITVQQSGDRWIVQPSEQGAIVRLQFENGLVKVPPLLELLELPGRVRTRMLERFIELLVRPPRFDPVDGLVHGDAVDPAEKLPVAVVAREMLVSLHERLLADFPRILGVADHVQHGVEHRPLIPRDQLNIRQSRKSDRIRKIGRRPGCDC